MPSAPRGANPDFGSCSGFSHAVAQRVWAGRVGSRGISFATLSSDLPWGSERRCRCEQNLSPFVSIRAHRDLPRAGIPVGDNLSLKSLSRMRVVRSRTVTSARDRIGVSLCDDETEGSSLPLASFYTATLSKIPAFLWLVLSPPCTGEDHARQPRLQYRPTDFPRTQGSHGIAAPGESAFREKTPGYAAFKPKTQRKPLSPRRKPRQRHVDVGAHQASGISSASQATVG